MYPNSKTRKAQTDAENHFPFEAMIGTDPTGRITAWDHTSELLTGYSATEILGVPASFLIAEHNSACIINTMIGLLSLGERISHREMTWRHKNGQSINIQISIQPLLNKRGELTGSLGSFGPYIRHNKHSKTVNVGPPGSTHTKQDLRA